MNKIVQKVTTFLVMVFNLPIYWISNIYPKEKNLWLFGAWGGEKYCDSSKYLFEYVNNQCPTINAIWFTKNKQVLKMVKNKGYTACLAYSLKGYLLSIRAKVGVISVGTGDINKYAIGKMKIVQLWHGIPLKPVVYSDPKKVTKNNLEKLKKLSYIFPFLLKGTDCKGALVVSSSEETKALFSRIFNTKNVKITGYPKYDSLFMNNLKNIKINNFFLEYKKKGFKLGLYAPTYRKKLEFDIVNYLIQNLNIINKRLREMKIILAIRLHPANFKEITIEPSRENFIKSNIRIINDTEIEQDIYSILSIFDFLITDYSSIFFDYLLLDRPIIFTPFDIEQYIQNNDQFLYDYKKITPGPKARDWNEVLEYIHEINDITNTYQKEREKIRNIFHRYVDGNNCKRVYEMIIKEIS